MYKVSKTRRRAIKVRGKAAKFGYEFKQLRPEHVNGKKPQGWNLAKSAYKVRLKLAYLVVQYPGQGGKAHGHVEHKTHSFTVKAAVFNNRTVPRREWLESKIHEYIAGAIDMWKAQDLDEWLDDDLTIKAEPYPSKNELIITRTG